MNIKYTKGFNRTVKKLKRYAEEQKNLKDITEKITNHDTFKNYKTTQL